MKIDLSRLKRKQWFEDEAGNVYDCFSDELPKDIDYFTYHHVYPCMYTEEVASYTCHPEYFHENNTLYQMLLHIRPFYRWMLRKHKNRKTFKHIFSSNHGYGSKFSQECIVAMVNSGDYTLEEAIYVYSKACERCMNVLLNKYLHGIDGYEEYSEEWKKCNTVCDFCREDEEK